MTYEEAIDELKNNYVITNGTVDGKPLFESIYLAIECIEKQIPKAPAGDWYECPNCKKTQNHLRADRWCSECGQHLKWNQKK